MLLPFGFPCARLLALGASSTMHLLVVGGLASLLDHRSSPHLDHAARLTVISFQPDRPSAKREPHPRAEARISPREPGPTMKAVPVPVAGMPAEAPDGLATTTEPLPVEPARSPEFPMSNPVGPPSHAAANPDTALGAYKAMLWTKIDANRPRGAVLKGTAVIRFQLLADGSLLAAQVARSSGNILLDKIALRSVRQAAPFPRPPDEIPASALVFDIPITVR